MNEEIDTPAELLKREMYTHLATLRDRCDSLLASKHPMDVYNEVQGLKSLVGQIASTSWRYRKIS